MYAGQYRIRARIRVSQVAGGEVVARSHLVQGARFRASQSKGSEIDFTKNLLSSKCNRKRGRGFHLFIATKGRAGNSVVFGRLGQQTMTLRLYFGVSVPTVDGGVRAAVGDWEWLSDGCGLGTTFPKKKVVAELETT